jgi:hypothetical protein
MIMSVIRWQVEISSSRQARSIIFGSELTEESKLLAEQVEIDCAQQTI